MTQKNQCAGYGLGRALQNKNGLKMGRALNPAQPILIYFDNDNTIFYIFIYFSIFLNNFFAYDEYNPEWLIPFSVCCITKYLQKH